MNCIKCGALNNGTSKYCQKCGERLVQELSCANCGKALKPDANFCVGCGTQVNHLALSEELSFNRNNTDILDKTEIVGTPWWAWLAFIIFTLFMISVTGWPGLIVGPIAYYYYVARHEK